MRVAASCLALALLLAPATAASQEHADHPDLQADIAKGTAAWQAAFNSGDGAAVAALYTDDAALLPPGGDPVRGLEAIQAYWTGAASTGETFALTTVEVTGHGDMAVEVGTYSGAGADGAHTDHGKFMVLWMKVDGTWKMHRDMWNSSMMP